MGLQEQIEPIAEPDSNACVTVGTFDGVHRGHQTLLRRVVEIAQNDGAKSVALSFRQPPRSIIDPSRKTPQLYDADVRVALIREQGIDTVQLIDFSDAIRVMSAEQFLCTLRESLGMSNLVIGERALLGHDRLNPDQIAVIGQRIGFDVHTMPPVVHLNQTISSSSIRSALASGDVKSATDKLGRLYERGGEVVHGTARAREMGVPTANLEWSDKLVMPAKGIYATWAKLPDGRALRSGTYIGDNATFGNISPSFEVHIDDFNEDLYGQQISVEFIEFIRPDHTFDTVELLEIQIQKDIENINRVFDSLPQRTP